jgi:tripartite-type tricarboxylate transporter receptor subunit TctC
MDRSSVRRRTFLASGVAGASIGLAGCIGTGGLGSIGAGEEGYPSETVRLVVPFSTGGGFDAYARISQSYWEQYLGEGATVVVENVEGAGGRTGAARVYNKQENPHWMLFWYPSAALPPQIVTETAYDITEMPPIGAMVRDPNALVLRSDTGIETFNQFIDSISELTFGTQGVGSAAHTVTLMLSAVTGAFPVNRLQFVHYAGTSGAQTGMARGEIDAMIVGTVSSAAQVAASVDSAQLFCVFSSPANATEYERQTQYYSSAIDSVPDLDRYAELTQFIRMLVAPPEVPAEPLSALRNAFSKLIDDEAFRQEAADRNRPITNPGNYETVAETLRDRAEVYGSEPLRGVFNDAFS